MGRLKTLRMLAVSALLTVSVVTHPQAMGCPTCGIGTGTPEAQKSYILLVKMQQQVFRNTFGIILNPADAPFDNQDMRHAVLNMFNVEQFLTTWSESEHLTRTYDLTQRYQSAFPYGWNAFEPFSEADWQRVSALVPDLQWQNVATSYAPKRSTRPLDRSAARGALRTMQELGYELGDDGWARNAEGAGVTMDVKYQASTGVRPALIQAYMIEPLKLLGIDARYDPGTSKPISLYDMVISAATLPDFKPSVSLSRIDEDVPRIIAALQAEAEAYYAGSKDPADLMAFVVPETPAQTDIHLLMRLLDKIIVSKSYFLPILYKCRTPTDVCRYPD